jgi:hypothetical protein
MPSVPGFIASVTAKAKTKPWLVIGKGPSFAKLASLDLSKYHSIALNHAVTKVPGVDYVHVADLDVFDKISDCLMSCTTSLVSPYFLHDKNTPDPAFSVDKLAEIATKPHHDLFKHLVKTKRITAYVSSRSKHLGRKPELGRSIYVRYFSSVAVVNLLCACGVKDITLIGIDGGSSYDSQFSDLTALTNGRKSFDVQFKEIDKTVRRQGVRLTRIRCDA